mmetsp:Transcript_25601/g.46364  ORF Transcript_25601/g.46364 Transcript_25601/m.46364 type:complete len:86 (+) Transcript_25601:312-569(+)
MLLIFFCKRLCPSCCETTYDKPPGWLSWSYFDSKKNFKEPPLALIHQARFAPLQEFSLVESPKNVAHGQNAYDSTVVLRAWSQRH